MTILDYFVLIVVVASVASGATRGVIKGIISVSSAVAGLVLAAQLYPYAASLLGGFVSTARAANLLGFVAVFLTVLVGGSLLARLMRGGLKRARLDWLDHVLGAAFGLARGWLVCSVIYLALTAFPVKIEAVERATFAPALLEGTRVIAYLTSPELRERFTSGYTAVRQMWETRKK
ncbi:MAG TPA: CvpA family protein [Blastocatellia bacterium]|jgi:membrane protein required for colicin V production|nr:CvpA family protein [Blastocatellia bacterium]